MKMNKTIKKTALLIVLASLALLFLSACSGVLGGNYNVRISVPQLASGDGRYVSDSAVSGYAVVLAEDDNKVFSLNRFSDLDFQEFIHGNVYIANLPVGTYIFGIVLLDAEDNNVGLAIKKREIKEGFNDIVIDVGPGISTFYINEISFEDFFAPDGYSTIFDEDTIILDIDRVADGEQLDKIQLSPDPGLGASVLGITLPEGNPTAGPWFLGSDDDGVNISISEGLLQHPYTLKVILK